MKGENKMQTQQTSKTFGLSVIFAALCLSLAAIVPASTVPAASVPAAPACKTYRLEVPDPAGLHLKDGEQVIASTSTPNGALEARVTVRGGVASEPRYYLGGKLFEKIPDSKVPDEVRECLKGAQRALNVTPSSGELAGASRPALSLLAPVAYRKDTKCVVLSAGCLGNYCFATVCCERGVNAECAYATARIR
jgi:hypothetical protein